MKKILIFVLCLSALAMSGCGKSKNNSEGIDATQQATATAVPVEKGAISAQNDGDSIVITLPASAFGEDSEKMAESIKEKRGFSEAVVNEDGSVSFKMTKKQHEEWIKETGESIMKTINGLVEGSQFLSVKKIDVNESFNEANISVDKAMYEKSMDKSIAEAVAQSMFSYQSCNGVAKEDLKSTVSFIDEASGDVIETLEF